jgi:type IV pilus assembly protein PilE
MLGEAAFTLIELLIVMNIIGILTMLAAPSYLSFKDRASKSAAKANVRNASEAISAYYQDNQTYVGMDLTKLRTYNGALPTITIIGVNATSFCVVNTVKGWPAYKQGPGGQITITACAGP